MTRNSACPWRICENERLLFRCLLLLLPLFILIVAFASCRDQDQNVQEHKAGTGQRDDLEAIAAKRVYFGHQSVGIDILNGMEDIQKELGVSVLHIARVQYPVNLCSSFFAESSIGENGLPGGKCDAFADSVHRIFHDSLDIAVMKFCFVDITDKVNVQELFAHYSRVIDELKSKCPHIAIVHMTVPLQVRSPWWKRSIKGLLGMQDLYDLNSTKTQEFNAMLLERYKGEPVLDLAKIESTYPDGTRNSFTYKGKTGYCLIKEYTSDGGHLNGVGRKIVAAEFIRVLGRVAQGGAR